MQVVFFKQKTAYDMRISDWSSDVCSADLSARLDPFALGLEVQSFVEVRISLDAHTDFEAAVMAHPAVLECHTTAGDSDYMLKLFARSVDHLDELLRHDLSKLPGVHRLATVVCLKTIKRQGRLAEWARTTEQQWRSERAHV